MSKPMQDAKIREVASGIYQIHMPLPMRPTIVNIHLVRSGDEWALFDTGMHTEDSIATLKSAIKQVGCPPEAITKLICTHHHADHFGTSRTYKEMTGAEVYLNPLEKERVERMQSNVPRPEALEFFRSHGLPMDEFQDGPPTPGRYFGTRYVPTMPDHDLEDGQTLQVGDREVVVVWTPGHTPGHCCFYFPVDKVMIVGDHLLPKITPHVGVFYTGPQNPLQDFINSHKKIQDFDVELVLPAHGGNFKDHRYRAKQIIQHHTYRLKEILDQAHGRPITAFDIASNVFALEDGDLPIFHLMAATFETLAHLHLLMYDGKVQRIEEDGYIRFIAQ